MAFKRSWVRLPSAPPPFALEPPELRVASHFFQQDSSGRNDLLERRVSPEASSSAKASEDIPRSFNEGELAQGDCLFVIALESQSFGWQATLIPLVFCRDATTFQSGGCPPKPPPPPRLRDIPRSFNEGELAKGDCLFCDRT